MPLSIEPLIRFPIFPEYFSFRKGKDELPNLWIFLRLKWAPKIISGLWVGIFSECDARWSLRMWVTGALPGAAQDGLQVSLRDLEPVPRWVKWYSVLSPWTLKVGFMACFASPPSSLKTKTKTCDLRNSFVPDPPKLRSGLWCSLPSTPVLRSEALLNGPAWRLGKLKGRILEGYLKTPAHDSSSQGSQKFVTES